METLELQTQASDIHRFTAEVYHRMAETGILTEDDRVELIEGQIIDMAPIGSYHGGMANRLNWLFSESSRGRWLVSVQNSLALSDTSEPEPDLMLLKPNASHYTDRLPRPKDVFLLVEISEHSLRFD